MVRSKAIDGERATEPVASIHRATPVPRSVTERPRRPVIPATILHLIDTGGPGGAETIYSELASGLDTERWRSVAAVPETGWLCDTLRARGVAPRLVPTQGSFDFGFLRHLDRLIRRERVDLIHAHLLTSGVYGGLAGRLRRIPVICTLHGQADFGPNVRSRVMKMRLLGAFSTKVVAVSESLRRLILMAGVGPSRTEVIHNGIDTRTFVPGTDASLRDAMGVAGNEVLIGAVGNVRPSKDYAVLLRAAARLRQSPVRYRFVIAGDASGPLFDELVRMRRELGVDDIVTFLGFQRDVARVIQNLDIFVITSSSEGFSLATIQALACGVPVVATRCGGPEEILEDGVTGLLAPTGSPDAVAAAIESLVADSELQAKFARAGRRLVEQRYARKAMLESYDALYERCLGGRARWRRS